MSNPSQHDDRRRHHVHCPVMIPRASRSGSATAFVAATALSLLVTGVHCLTCNELGCTGGLFWRAAPDDGGLIAPGRYELAIELDGEHYDATCEIADRLSASVCSEAVSSEDDGQFDVLVQLLARQPGDRWDPDAPIEALLLDASAHDEDDRGSSSVWGPRDVEIELRLGERVLVSSSYDIEYVRDEDFYGDERCGFCDLEESREAVWTP